MKTKISRARFAPNYAEGIGVRLNYDGPDFEMVEGSVEMRNAPNEKVANIDALIRWLIKHRREAVVEAAAQPVQMVFNPIEYHGIELLRHRA